MGYNELAHVEKSRLVGSLARPNCSKWKRKVRDHRGKSVVLTDLQGKRKLEQVGMDCSELEADISKKLRTNNPSNTEPVVLVLDDDMDLENVDSKVLDSDTSTGNSGGIGGCTDFSSTYFSAVAKEQTARSPWNS